MMCAAVVPGVAAQHTWAASCSACCPTGPRACEPCSTCCSTTTAGPASLCATQPSTPLAPPPWLLPPPRRGRPRPRAPPRRSRRSSELARMATGSLRPSEGGRPSRARRSRSRMPLGLLPLRRDSHRWTAQRTRRGHRAASRLPPRHLRRREAAPARVNTAREGTGHAFCVPP